MFGFNQDFSFMEAEKENYGPDMDDKISPFDIEAKRTEIFERLFSKSAEITNLANEMTNSANHLSKRDGFIKQSDSMEIVDPPYSRYLHSRSNSFRESFSSNYNAYPEFRVPRDSQRRISTDISPMARQKPKDDNVSSYRDDGEDQTLNLKAPTEEMKENIEHLEMLLKYQHNFCNRLHY